MSLGVGALDGGVSRTGGRLRAHLTRLAKKSVLLRLLGPALFLVRSTSIGISELSEVEMSRPSDWPLILV